MRIVMLCRLYAPHIGGVEKHVAGIATEAVKEGNTVDVFTLKHDNNLPTFEIQQGIRIHRKPQQLHSRILKFFLPALLSHKISQYIIERDEMWGWMLWNMRTFLTADVIQVHDVFFWYWPIRILLPWKKVYITFHGFEPSSVKTSAGEGRQIEINPKVKRTRQMIQRWTNGSMAVGSWIEKWYGTKPNEVTYGAGSCVENVKVQIPNAKLSSKIKCVFIGRISTDTGAKVYEKVIGSLPDYDLDMYGEGSSQGTVDDSCTVFPKYDIACVSSYLSIAEAMQSRVLVLAYAVDDLKWDYLHAHPRAQDMVIVRSDDEMRNFLKTYEKKNFAHRVDDAYDWARQQTWNRVFLKYKKLWGWEKYEN